MDKLAASEGAELGTVVRGHAIRAPVRPGRPTRSRGPDGIATDPVRDIVRDRSRIVKPSVSDLAASMQSRAETMRAVPTLWVAWDASSTRLRMSASDGVDLEILVGDG
jgi:hypothetical protein